MGLTWAQLDALSKRYTDAQEWLDYRAALITAVIANVNRDPKKKHDAFTPQDFMPKRGKAQKKRVLSPDELIAQIRLMNAAAGGKEVING